MNKNELVCYNTDGSGIEGKAKKVVFPRNVEEVRKIVNNNNNNEGIVIRGSGSNIVGGCIPNDSVVVDMKKMNKISFENGNVYAEPGTTIKELNEKLKAVKSEFPIFSRESTIGGMVAMNSIGFMGGYGNIKDWIDQIEFVNGRGEIIKVGRADLSDVCGMEGITGIITKVKLNVIPIKERSFSFFQTEDLEEIWPIARRLKLENEIVMLKFYSKSVSKLLGFPEKYHVIVCFNSNRGAIKGEKYKSILNIIEKDYLYLHSQGYCYREDPQLFFDKLKDFVAFLDRLKVPYCGDLDLGIIYPFFEEDDKKKEEVMKMIKRMNAKPGKYGIGIKRKDLLDRLEKRIIQRIKLRHDPFGKLNKGNVIDINKTDIKKGKRIEKEIEVSEEIEKNNFDEVIEIREKITDYEDTFKSELGDERKEEIEKFVKDITKGIVKKEFVDEKIERVGDVVLDDNLSRKSGKISEDDKNLIDKIMFNSSREKDKEEKEGSKGDKKNED